MNPEKMPGFFPKQAKIQKEAQEINEKVDQYYKKPRTKKERPKTNVADEAIKENLDASIKLNNIPEKEKQWYENLRDSGIKILGNGYLNISRWEKKDNGKIKITWQKVDGLESAIRMQDKILEKYRVDTPEKKSEYSQIESVEEVLQYANDFLTKWKTISEADKEEIQFQLAGVVLQLENCVNEYKVAAREKSEKVMNLKDSRGRVNPGAFAAETVSALNNLTKRIGEMREIMPIIAMRKEVLILEKRRIEDELRKASAPLHGVLNHPVFRENSKKPSQELIRDNNEANQLDRKIGQALYHLASIRIFPYLSQARQAEFHLKSEAKKNFSSKNKLIENLGPVREALQEAVKILETNFGYLDNPKK